MAEELPNCVTVGPEGQGLRLDVFLSKRFPSWSRSFWTNVTGRGGVTVQRPGQKAAKASAARRVREGDLVIVDQRLLTKDTPLEYQGEIPVLLQTPDYVVVDKPPGLLSHPAGRFGTGSLVDLLRVDHGSLHPCGRLDRFTSGVNMFARSSEAQLRFEAAHADGLVTKEYLALVEGTPEPLEGVVSAPLGRDEDSPIRIKSAVVKDGKPCRTGYRVLGSAGGFSLVLATLHTGRKHQIRIHLAHLGCPVMGDKLYGREIDHEFFSPDRSTLHSYHPGWQALHCLRLTVPPGMLGPEAVTVVAWPSSEFAATLTALDLEPRRLLGAA